MADLDFGTFFFNPFFGKNSHFFAKMPLTKISYTCLRPLYIVLITEIRPRAETIDALRRFWNISTLAYLQSIVTFNFLKMFLRLKTKRFKNLTLIRHHHFKLHRFQCASLPARMDILCDIIDHIKSNDFLRLLLRFFSTGTIENNWFKNINFPMKYTVWKTRSFSASV